MIHRKTPDLENKLLLLYAVDQLGPLTGLQLLQFLAEYDLMDYITMQLTLGDLAATGHLESLPSILGARHALTGQGRDSLSLFLRRLPHSIRSLVRDAATQWKPRFQRETQILSDFERRDDGMHALRLRLMEKDAALLDMTLFLPTRDLADWFSRRWPAAAEGFYGFLMNTLGDNFSAEESSHTADASRPQGAYIHYGCAQGCILKLERGESAAPALALSLALPTASMAVFFAERWAQKADDICAFLMHSLTQEEQAE